MECSPFYKNPYMDFILPHSSKNPNLGDQVSTCNSVFSTWKAGYIIPGSGALLPMLSLFQLLGRPPSSVCRLKLHIFLYSATHDYASHHGLATKQATFCRKSGLWNSPRTFSWVLVNIIKRTTFQVLHQDF